MKDSILLDVDKIAKEIYCEDEEVLKDLQNCFGRQVFCADGTVNYKALANKVFSSKAELDKLNNLMLSPIENKISGLLKINKDKKYIIIDAAVLFNTELYKLCDYIILVRTGKKRQMQFLKVKFMLSNSLYGSPESLKGNEIENEVGLRIKGQHIKINKKLVDFVIDNEGSVPDLYKKVEIIAQKIMRELKEY